MFGLNHKALQEEAIVRKREMARIKNEYWKSTSSYFDRYQSQAERFNLWSSDEMAKKRWEFYIKNSDVKRRKMLLKKSEI